MVRVDRRPTIDADCILVAERADSVLLTGGTPAAVHTGRAFHNTAEGKYPL